MRSWPLWICVIAAASGPWFGFVSEPQWSRVTWIPFHGSEDTPRDIAVNFLMFVPFGWSFVKTPRPAAILHTVLAAAAVSAAVEAPQLFYRLRDPSATDVVMAICGAGAGSLASQAFYRRYPRGTPGGSEARDGGGEQ